MKEEDMTNKGVFNKGIKNIKVNIKPTGYKLNEEKEEERRQEMEEIIKNYGKGNKKEHRNA